MCKMHKRNMGYTRCWLSYHFCYHEGNKYRHTFLLAVTTAAKENLSLHFNTYCISPYK